MTKLFVSPPAETDWALSPRSLAARMQTDWPDAEVRIPPHSGRTIALDFSCAVDGEIVHGSLDRPGQALEVEASPRAAARVITWFRELVPAEQDLIAYDESFGDSMPVPPGTTVQDLEAVFA